MQTAAFVLALVGAASALVARQPIPPQAGANTLIQYQPWCPVCDTVATNTRCLSSGASCMSSVFVPGDNADCAAQCAASCQRTAYVANSDYGYTCNTTLSSTK